MEGWGVRVEGWVVGSGGVESEGGENCHYLSTVCNHSLRS